MKTKATNIIYANYDWDDNVMFMPTNIIYFAKDKTAKYQEIPVSTENFAHTRLKVSKESHVLYFTEENGILTSATQENHTVAIDVIDYEPTTEDSFREFRDCPNNQYFLNDLKKALNTNKFGPSFNDFVEHCSTKEMADYVTIITARGQSPQAIYEGLKLLQELKYIAHLPKITNIFPVSYKGLNNKYVASASNPSESKMNILLGILDDIETKAKECNKNHTFGFSDDDKKTFDTVKSKIDTEVEGGRWKHIEINVYFTGNKLKERHILLKKESSLEVA